MKRAILSAAVFILTAALHAQTIAGTWQGILPIAPTGQGTGGPGTTVPRIVFTIDKAPDGSYRGAMALIDRGTPIPLASATFSAPNVTFTVADTLTYHGKLAADGKSIAGTWTQGTQSLPLNLQLATSETLWKPERPAQLPPMAATADPAFEVAIIKPTGPDENNTLFDLRARKFNSQHTSATELIKIAYNVRGRQIPRRPALAQRQKVRRPWGTRYSRPPHRAAEPHHGPQAPRRPLPPRRPHQHPTLPRPSPHARSQSPAPHPRRPHPQHQRRHVPAPRRRRHHHPVLRHHRPAVHRIRHEHLPGQAARRRDRPHRRLRHHPPHRRHRAGRHDLRRCRQRPHCRRAARRLQVSLKEKSRSPSSSSTTSTHPHDHLSIDPL